MKKIFIVILKFLLGILMWPIIYVITFFYSIKICTALILPNKVIENINNHYYDEIIENIIVLLTLNFIYYFLYNYNII